MGEVGEGGGARGEGRGGKGRGVKIVSRPLSIGKGGEELIKSQAVLSLKVAVHAGVAAVAVGVGVCVGGGGRWGGVEGWGGEQGRHVPCLPVTFGIRGVGVDC